jgi:hypothetical protein
VAKFGVVRQIWRTRQTNFFSNFCSRTVIEHFPPATWQPLIGPCGGLSLGHVVLFHASHHAMSSCHVSVQTVWTATWHDPIGPRIDPKMPKLGDTWQPLVLPHHHVDIMMTSTCHVSPSFSFHVCCMDVDVNSTDVDSSPADWARLTKL